MDKKEIEQYIDKNKQEMIETLAEFVSINSIYDSDSASKKDPFGKGVSKALNYFANLAKKAGFEVKNYDNYCVEVSYGKGELVDILAHCDVVDVSSNWQFPPFAKLYDDTYIYGRGTQDDKGPLLAAFYALKAIKDNNLACNKQIRFIVGGNEESGSECLKYYYQTLKKEYPKLGFTPDADFPLINGEKGITRIKVNCGKLPLDIENIEGGRALNIVMDEVKVLINNKEKKYFGKAVHASKPELGENAFVKALEDLKTEYKELEKIYLDFKDYNGRGLGIDCYDDKLKELTMNIGKVEVVNRDLILTLDIRYPLATNANKIKKIIDAKGYISEILMEEKPIYSEKDSYLVKTLLSSYDYFMKTKSEPFTLGGGTYAKSSKNVVAFGMLFPSDEDLMHQDNECIRIDHYLLGAKIYLKALIELIK